MIEDLKLSIKKGFLNANVRSGSSCIFMKVKPNNISNIKNNMNPKYPITLFVHSISPVLSFKIFKLKIMIPFCLPSNLNTNSNANLKFCCKGKKI